MTEFGGGMRRDDQIRANGVAPVPVADARQYSQQCGPNIRSPHQNFVFALESETYQPKNVPEVQEPGGFLRAGVASPVGLRSAAQQPSFLDYLQTNRNKNAPENLRVLGRKPYCGAYTVAGRTQDGTVIFHRVLCKCWGCAYCGPRKANRYRHSIREIAERRKLNRFLTLTLDPSKIEGDPVVYLRSTYNKFRTYLRRECGVSISYIAILEFQKNGNPHLHVLIDRFIPQKWLAASWERLGGGRIVDIRYVDVHRISNYLSKYLTKALLLSAPAFYRRVTTSRDIHLTGKLPKEIAWALLKIPIFQLFERLCLLAIAVEQDSDGLMSSFAIFGGR